MHARCGVMLILYSRQTRKPLLREDRVEISLSLEVDDPQGFVDDARSAPTMKKAVAEMSGAEEDDVSVELSVGNATTRRRLRDAERRLQEDEVVICDANISVADTTAANSMETTLEALSTAAIADVVQQEFITAGIEVEFNVTSAISVQIVLPPSPPPSPGSGQASAASSRWRSLSLAPLCAVSAWLLSNA